MGTDPHLAKLNPAIHYAPQALKNLTSPPARQKALIIPTCCTCLTITLILISEQPTDTLAKTDHNQI